MSSTATSKASILKPTAQIAPLAEIATVPTDTDPCDPDTLFETGAANIDIDIPPGGFVDVIHTPGGPNDERLTTATWTLRPGGPANVTQGLPPTPGIGGGKLTVEGGPAVLAFQLPPNSKHRLLGVAFKMVRGNNDIHGNENLPKERIRAKKRANGSSTVYVTDVWKNHGPQNTWNWDFYIFIQDESGNIGIIDPDIENKD